MTEDYSFPPEDFILLGKVAKAHGLRGEVKIFPFSGMPENFAEYQEFIFVDRSGNLSPVIKVESSRAQGKTAVVKLASVTTRNQAEELEGLGVLLSIDHLPEASADEYYWHQYEGKLVVDESGKTIGKVSHLFNNGAQDILVIEDGKDEFLIPVTKDIVIDETRDKLIVKPPPGLLELYSESGGPEGKAVPE